MIQGFELLAESLHTVVFHVDSIIEIALLLFTRHEF